MKEQNFLEKYPKRYNIILMLTAFICIVPLYVLMKMFNYVFFPNPVTYFEKIIDMGGTFTVLFLFIWAIGVYIGVPLFNFLLKKYIAFLEKKNNI